MELSRPHDKYFRRVFSNKADAASLLRAYVPEAVAMGFDEVAKHVVVGQFEFPVLYGPRVFGPAAS